MKTSDGDVIKVQVANPILGGRTAYLLECAGLRKPEV